MDDDIFIDLVFVRGDSSSIGNSWGKRKSTLALPKTGTFFSSRGSARASQTLFVKHTRYSCYALGCPLPN